MVDKVLRTRLRGPSFGCVYRLATRRIMLPAVFPVLDVGGVLQTNLYWGAPGGAGMPNPAFPALRRRREPQEPSAENLPHRGSRQNSARVVRHFRKSPGTGLIEDMAPKYRRKRADSRPAGSIGRSGHCAGASRTAGIFRSYSAARRVRFRVSLICPSAGRLK